MEMRSASRSSGKTAAINAANTPVTTVDTCGVLKRGWQRLMNGGSSPSSAIESSMRGCPSSEVRMTEVIPAMTPTFRIHESQASCGWASSATATGASESDRKSTRLNSSHGYISYAVFCLKKKKKIETDIR